MKKIMLTGALGAAALVFAGAAASAATLDDVKAKGFVQCGVSQGLPGFSNPDADGNWSGLDVDLCRAVAAAIFGTPLAGVILAIELLLFEFRPRSFIPLVIATAVATPLRHALIGDGPLFAQLSGRLSSGILGYAFCVRC